MRHVRNLIGCLFLAATVASCTDHPLAPEADSDIGMVASHQPGPAVPWVLQQAGLFQWVDFVDVTRGWASDPSGVWRTTNGGAQWTHMAGSPTGVRGLSFIDANNGWLVILQAIYNTTDGGVNWTPQFTNWAPGNSALDVDFVDAQHGFASGTAHKFYRTTNGGANWTLHFVNMATGSNHDLRIDFVDANNGWGFSFGGRISHTTNGGLTWTRQQSGTTSWFSGGHFIDANTGWIVGSGGVVVHTTDGGATWTIQQTPTTMGLRGVSFVDANNGWVSGLGGTILHTTDGGATWSFQASDTPNAFLQGISAVDPGHAWIAGSFGSSSGILALNVPNNPPVANAGSDQTVTVGETVQLDGSGSSDPDGDPITYGWQIISQPGLAALLNPSAANPTFVPDVAGEYVVQLIVNDGSADSEPDNVTITVQTPAEATQSLIDDVTALIETGELTQGEGTSLLAKLNAALRRLNRSSGPNTLTVVTQEANPGDVKAVINQLEAFINQVNAFVRSGRLSEAEGQSLIDAVQAIIDALAG